MDIDIEKGSAIFDFAGTGTEVWGNTNAPRAVTMSAIIYCLRCLVGHDIPLNQGCLNPVEVKIPVGSMLDPSDNAAVVGKPFGISMYKYSKFLLVYENIFRL